MKRETLEWLTAKAIANQNYLDLNFGACIGNFFDLKEYCWNSNHNFEYFDNNEPEMKGDEVSQEDYFKLPEEDRYGLVENDHYFKLNPEWKKWKRNEVNKFAKKFAKENGIENTKESWFSNSEELSGYSWYESDKDFARMLLESDYFCDLSDEELVEEYYKYA